METLPYMEIPADRVEPLHRALGRLIRSRRAFIRAWAYNGLGVLAAADPGLRAEVDALFDAAEGSESASVRVRIRRAREALSKQASGSEPAGSGQR